MKLPTREQEAVVIAADHLLTFMVQVDWKNDEVKKLLETKLTQALVGCDIHEEKAEALFLEAAIKYVNEV